MCKIQIDDRILSSSKPAKWADVESIISQELSHLSPCTRIVSVTIETTTDSKEKVLMEEMRKQKAEYDNGMAERIENFVKTGTK
ncbi:MAG TPA: hypothetical protein DIT75_05350 [Rikenellaceae bacterium]|nr:hypothetical protein [Rikenellaceae bacterium]